MFFWIFFGPFQRHFWFCTLSRHVWKPYFQVCWRPYLSFCARKKITNEGDDIDDSLPCLIFLPQWRDGKWVRKTQHHKFFKRRVHPLPRRYSSIYLFQPHSRGLKCLNHMAALLSHSFGTWHPAWWRCSVQASHTHPAFQHLPDGRKELFVQPDARNVQFWPCFHKDCVGAQYSMHVNYLLEIVHPSIGCKTTSVTCLSQTLSWHNWIFFRDWAHGSDQFKKTQ